MSAPAVEQHSETGWAYGVIYDDLGACGCGQHHARLELARDVLAGTTDEQWVRPPDESPLAEWFLHLLDHADLIDHGSSIRTSWLTEKGRRFLAVLQDPAAFAALTGDDHAAGYCPAGRDCTECALPGDAR